MDLCKLVMLRIRAGILIALLTFLSGCEQPSTEIGAAELHPQSLPNENMLVAQVALAGNATSQPAAAKIFVFVRVTGTSMPLAVEQFNPSDLPTAVGFAPPKQVVGQVEVVARLSLTGAVSKQPGDQEVISEPISIDQWASNILLTIPVHELPATATTSKQVGIKLRTKLPSGINPPPTAKVFVIAKMVDAASPMPLAVKAYSLDSIPATITLTDQDSMTTVARLSSQNSIEVFARLSMGGQTQQRPGDWESAVHVISTNSLDVTDLELNQLIP